jgi:ribosomal protein S18 acetylase RimI-like enzyme
MVLPSKPEIKLLSECSLNDAASIWNRGFDGYVVDMTVSLETYLSRLYRERIAPACSFIAFVDDSPAGFLLNGICTDQTGRSVAWNGGTGVATEHRGTGLGRLLLEAAIDLYREKSIAIATLEAVSNNDVAISLYEKFDYQITEKLLFLEKEGFLDASAFANSSRYQVRSVAPAAVQLLEFYPDVVPWQAQWQSLSHNRGQAVIASDQVGVDVGFALYRSEYDNTGRLKKIVLAQCFADPNRADQAAVVETLLASVFGPLDVSCQRVTHNFSDKNKVAVHLMKQAGFTNFIEQVHMVRTFCVERT